MRRVKTLLALTTSGLALTLGACSAEESDGTTKAEQAAENAQDAAQDHAGEAKDDHSDHDHGSDDGGMMDAGG